LSVPAGGRGRKRTGAAAPRAPKRRRASLHLSIPSETRFLALVRDVTKNMAETAGFPEPTTERLALAVDEATTNVIEHAYRGAGDREIELRMEDRGADFRVELIDTGEMVDPRAVPRVDLERYASERKTGGLGMHLMEKIMDSVTFRRSARRNVCAMVKHKDTPEAPES
jgi:serine/threonine-protein kinase RsbW